MTKSKTGSQKYDLEDRTAKFGEDIIKLVKKTNPSIIVRPILSQLIRSATSVGANYMEANGAVSRKDFRNKIHLCKKEIQETKHWLRMLTVAVPSMEEETEELKDETEELIKIFQKISSSLKTEN